MIDLAAKRSFAAPSLRMSDAQKYYSNRFLFSISQLRMTAFKKMASRNNLLLQFHSAKFNKELLANS